MSGMTLLSHAAPPFVHADVTPTPIYRSSVGGHNRQRPPKFNTTWESYHAAFLATSLDGSAANVLGGMNSTKRHSYCSLVTALETRFGTTGQRELSRMKLRSRRRRKGEPLPELAEDIERLSRLV